MSIPRRLRKSLKQACLSAHRPGPSSCWPRTSSFRKNSSRPDKAMGRRKPTTPTRAVRVPTVAIDVDYQKAFDRVWHIGLLVKLFRMDMPMALLEMVHSWLKGRTTSICFGNTTSDSFQRHVGLSQGSSLSLYICIVFHSDLVAHLFADDLNVLIRAPLQKTLLSACQVSRARRKQSVRQNCFVFQHMETTDKRS